MAQRFNPSSGLIEHYVIPKDGAQGPMGLRGPQGEQGPEGKAGPKGDPGKDGKNGRDGVDGKNGRDGINGAVGPQGLQGEKGDPGPAGTTIFRTPKSPEPKLGKSGDWAISAFQELWFKDGSLWRFVTSLGGGNTSRLSNIANDIIRRSTFSVSTNTEMGANKSTDYYYFATGTITLTLPTAVGNKNQYNVKNVGTGIITVVCTGSETVDGESSDELVVNNTSSTYLSDGSNWQVV